MSPLAWLANRVSRFYAERLEPFVFARRRARRLAAFGLCSLDDVPEVRFDLHAGCQTTALCAELARRYARYYGRFAHCTVPRRGAVGGIPAVLALRRYATAVAFQRQLRKQSSGFFYAAGKASKGGYTVAPFHPRNHTPDIREIRCSKRWRAFGPVLEVLTLTVDDLGGAPDHAWALAPPACVEHWERYFGVFLAVEGYRQGTIITGRRLVAYARLERIGNVVRYAEFIGHGDDMPAGVMALLHRQVVDWLLLPGNPLCQGLEYLTYGAIEQGRDGLAFWKRKALFVPARMLPARAGSRDLAQPPRPASESSDDSDRGGAQQEVLRSPDA